jgi:hypothetical protein
MPLPKIIFSLWVCFLALGLSGLATSQNKTKGDSQYHFEIDLRGYGNKIQVVQVLKSIDPHKCLTEFIFINRGKEVIVHDKCSLFPIPLDDLVFFKAEIVKVGEADTLEYITGVGVSGIQSRKKLIFDPVHNRAITIHYAEGGASSLEEARPIGKGKYLLALMEASYILPGYQGYGPSQYSGYIVEFLEKGTEVTHILNPIAKVDSESERDIKRIHHSEWCKFFYKVQMKEYQDALKKGKISKEGKAEIQQLIVKTKRFCHVK